MTRETHHPQLMGLNHTAHYAKSLMRPTALAIPILTTLLTYFVFLAVANYPL
jgi:hypothetical protein